jgi:hypothetical protein
LTKKARQLAGTEPEPTPMRGVTQPSRVGGRGGFLSDVIVDLGLAGEAAVARAIREAQETDSTVGAALLKMDVLDESQLARAIAEHHGFAYADLDEVDIDPTAVRLISRTAALRYRAAPIAVSEDGALLVAFVDPVDAFAVQDIEVTTKSKVRPVVAAASAVEALIATIPEEAEDSVNGHPDEVSDRELRALSTAVAVEEAAPLPTEGPPTVEEPRPQRGSLTPSPPEPLGSGGEDPSPRLQQKIASLIEGALEGVAESEVADLEAKLESARAEIEELAAQLDAARREEAKHAEREEALRAQFSAAQRAGEELKEALSNLSTVASEAQSAADSVADELRDPHAVEELG